MSKRKMWTQDEIDIAMKLCDDGYTHMEISKKIGVNVTTLQRKFRKIGYKRKLSTKECVICKKQFTPPISHPQKEYCSTYCIEHKRTMKRRLKNRKLKKCIYCNNWHYRLYTTCSYECSIKNKKIKMNIAKDKRMSIAKNNGIFDKDIDIYKLSNRDGCECYLCNKVLDFDGHYNDLDYPTIEHVIPIAKGGTHSWDNVKVACRQCNNKKGIKIIDEK